MDKVLVYPAYFPCILQMAAIVQSSSVIFEVHDNYQKQTYRNRAYIAHSNGLLLLNLPVVKYQKNKRKTKDIRPSYDENWQAHHYKSIITAYRSAPFFEYYIDDMKILFEQPVQHLQAHNLHIFSVLCDLLDLQIDTYTTDAFQTEFNGIDLRNIINAKKKVNHNFTPYTQVFEHENNFYPNLSILDLIFNLGPNTLPYLKEEKIDFKKISADL